MTTRAAIDAHYSGDCNSYDCPLCEYEDALEAAESPEVEEVGES